MGYYIYRQRHPSQRALQYDWLTLQIKRVFEKHKGRYGSPRIALELYNEGIKTNKRVVDMLRQSLSNRDFSCQQPNAISVSDIAYIRCYDGMLYLTLYLDLATQFPKSCGITENMKMNCVTDPLKRLIDAGYAQHGTIIHSVQGS